MSSTQNRKKKLRNIFLVPLIGLVLLQSVLLLSMLFFSSVKSTLENNATETDAHILENRQTALENTMLRDWGSLKEESRECFITLSKFLDKQEISVQDFLSEKELQVEYLQQIFPEVLKTVQQRNVSGGFLVLANDTPVEEAADYCGFFIRDLDPSRKTESNTDILMERGNKTLSVEAGISLDNQWSRNFHLAGNGKRSADDFYYIPYEAGITYPDVDMVNLGYWSSPFVLEGNAMDSHYMITYSLPLVCDGTIYGVLGTEISLGYIDDYLDVHELDPDLKAGYAMVKNQGDATYQCVLGKGTLYESVSRASETFTLKKSSVRNLYLVDGVMVGNQKIYALTSPLNLYSNNVPYENTQWELCAFVTENSIFETGERLYGGIILVAVICALLGLVVVAVVVRRVLGPVYRLMDSVRGGVEGIRKFTPSGIQELDELHDVVENVTEAQKEVEDKLVAEKERYRLAIESSDDIFFTYRKQEQCLELVNTEEWDGVWDCSGQTDGFKFSYVHLLDRAQLEDAFKTTETNVKNEFRMKQGPDREYKWYRLSARVIRDEKGVITMISGYLHNISQQKERELEEIRKKTTDPVTGFYRREEGLRLIHEGRSQKSNGVLFLLQIQSFRKLNEQYGLTFGDILLEKLSEYFCCECEADGIEDRILLRAGSSEIAGWFPEKEEEQIQELLERVGDKFSHIIDKKVIRINFACGLVYADDVTGIQTVIRNAKISLMQARIKNTDIVRYEELSDKEKTGLPELTLGEVISIGDSEYMNLVSIALNLFDRAGSVKALLDLFAAKLQKHYTLTNLLIISYNQENMVNSLEYCWKVKGNLTDGDVLRCQEDEISGTADPALTDERNVICAMNNELYQKPMFAQFIRGASGIAMNMTDNGQYSGTIFFEGLSESLVENEAERKELKEIATVIQNRINQEKHDLSAQAKSEFLARMSHEIRTPMNGIIGMTEIALKDDQSQEKQVDCLRKIRGSSQYLLSLVNDILDMSKIESGKMQITESKVDFRKKLYDLHDLIGAKLTEKNMHYTEIICLQHSWFWVDELRVRQVLINILGNAIKYTDEGGHIRFEVTEMKLDEETSKVHFAVTDDGIGISPEDQQLVFQSFEQVSHQDGVYRQGTGLGLAISNRLVHMMGGSIRLESEPGKGSTFSFTLHLKWAEEEKQEVASEKAVLDLKGKRIMIAEDNELNQEIIQTILEDYGIVVEIAADGQIAVDMMKASAPGYYDMIFMDIMMPNLNGLDATRQIRRLSHPDSKTIPIVAMTANAFAEEKKQSAASGMNAHLSKPLSIEKLQETLIKFLQ